MKITKKIYESIKVNKTLDLWLKECEQSSQKFKKEVKKNDDLSRFRN